MSLERKFRVLLAATALGAFPLLAAPAHADEAQLQQQINAMKRQLDAMQQELAKSQVLQTVQLVSLV